MFCLLAIFKDETPNREVAAQQHLKTVPFSVSDCIIHCNYLNRYFFFRFPYPTIEQLHFSNVNIFFYLRIYLM